MKTSLILKLNLLIALLALAAFFNSCASVDLSKMKDEELVSAGEKAWNTSKPEDARPYWSNIKDAKLKTAYLEYLSSMANFEKATDEVEKKAADPRAKIGKDVDVLISRFAAFPKNLKIPSVYHSDIIKLSSRGIEEYLQDGPVKAASDLLAKTEAIVGVQSAFDNYRQQIDSYNKLETQVAVTDKQISAARAQEDFHDKIAGYELAITTLNKAEASTTSELTRLGADDESALANLAASFRKRSGDTKVEMERQLRQRQYSFKERIGEEFARQPPAEMVGKMKPEDILKFNEETSANIEVQYQEMLEFGKRYPKIIDNNMLKDIEEQKEQLSIRIAEIVKEVAHAKDIASRGKAAMPLMIGLFNPQPGTKAEDKKSRPAKLKSTMTSNEEYWWGMISIDKGAMNDLVVTVSDGREVQIFNENTLSGMVIPMKGLKSVVSKANKVGNSWPVLNAGAQFPKNQYYIQLKKGSKADYTGDVVIYSSFISRMR